MRILNVAAGVLLIAAGIYCLCNQDVALLSAGLLLGIFLLLSGVAEIVVFAAASGVMLGSGWLLLDGILTVIMSLFLLFNQWFTMLSLPFLFTLSETSCAICERVHAVAAVFRRVAVRQFV